MMEGPAVDSNQRLVIFQAIDRLPGSFFPEEVKAPRLNQFGQLWKDPGIVIAGGRIGLYPMRAELFEAALQRGDGLEEAVVLLDEVTAEKDEVHFLFERAVDQPHPH